VEGAPATIKEMAQEFWERLEKSERISDEFKLFLGQGSLSGIAG
jgi:hypothetical protein